jgi:hypothetical protein
VERGEVWIVVYEHEFGVDVTPCENEEVAKFSVLALGEDYFDEFDDDENQYSDVIRKALDEGDHELLMRRWNDFSNGQEDISIDSQPLRLASDFEEPLDEFPWNLQPGDKVKWNNPEGDAYVFPIKSIIFDGVEGDMDGQVRIEHENGTLVTHVFTLEEVEE